MAPGDDAAIMRIVEALQARNIHVIVTDTREEANNALIQLLPEGAEICDSTSETLDAIGFTAFVRGNPRYKNLHDVYEAEPDWPNGMTYAVVPLLLTTLLVVCKPLPRPARSLWRVRREVNSPRMSMLPSASF